MVKALGAPPSLVSMESYPTTHCDWGIPFFFPLLKRTTYSDSNYCGAHKWLSEEKGMEKERVGSGFKRKAPIGTPFLLSNLLRDKKSYSLIPEDILTERRGVRGQHSLFQSASSSTELQINSLSPLWSTYSSLPLYWLLSTLLASSKTFPLRISGKFSIYCEIALPPKKKSDLCVCQLERDRINDCL